MAQYTVTGSTSIVLVNSLNTPNTVVWLSSIQYPGHIVSIRDQTGSSQITSKPIIVSTMQGLQFYDGASSIVIAEPYGSITVSSKDRSTWQLLNTVGFFTTLSNAYLDTLTSQFSYINTVSSIQQFVSTSFIENINITNTIYLGGNTQITGDIIVNGPVTFLSSMQVDKTLSLSSFFSVQGDYVARSSLEILGELLVGGFMSTTQNLEGGKTIVVDQNVSAYGILLPQHLSVQTIRMSNLAIGGGLQTAQSISSQSNANIGQDLLTLDRTLLTSSLTVNGATAIGGGLYATSSLQTTSLSTLGHVTVIKEGSIEGSLTVLSSASTFADVLIKKKTTVDGLTVIQGDVNVTGLSQFQAVDVAGNANISSFNAFSSVLIRDNALSYGYGLVIQKDFQVGGEFGIGASVEGTHSFVSFQAGLSTLIDLGVGDNLVVGGLLSVHSNVSVHGPISGVSTFAGQGNVSTLNLELYGDLSVLSKLTVGQVLGASTLGAPIDLTISTLTLSNTFYINSVGSVPLLDSGGYPQKMIVGPVVNPESYDMAVEGILQNRSTVSQTTYPDYSKLWYATFVNASTLAATTPVSSFVLGPAGATKPFQTFQGAILTGEFTGSPNLYYSSNISTNYLVASNSFIGTTGGYKVATNGSNQWVSVGDGGGIASNSIYVSRYGYSWTNATLGGFAQGGRSVAYGNGRFLAVGYTGGAGVTIQYSTDGLSWTGATNPFTAVGGGGDDIAYNGTSLWVAAGTNFPASFGMKYSGNNGSTWINGSLTPPVSFSGKGVGYGGGRWVASDGVNQMITSIDGANWTLIPGMPLGKTTFAYNGTYWLAGGPATGFNPTTSIHLSPNGLVWIPITSGGFTEKCNDLVWDSTKLVWYAVGSTNPNTTQILQYSLNGLNWIVGATNTAIGLGRGIALGTIEAPDTDNYFTANMTTIFRSTLSSLSLYASTVQVSSIQADHFTGEGSGLSNLVNFRSTLYTSSFLASNAYGQDISAQRLQTEYLNVEDSLTVLRNPFLSSIELWLAAGYDSQSNGNIQASYTGSNWIRGVGPSFNYFAKSITGNSNISSPLYVAVGADSRTQHTIQYSENGRIWNPVLQGGFDTAIDGLRTGNSVAYNHILDLWVAGGNNAGTTSTLFYSSDARNWFCGSNGFTDSATFVTASPTGFIALGTTIKYSSNGINWLDSTSPSGLALNTLAYGYVSTPVSSNAWIGISNTSIYISQTDGILWQQFTPSNTLAPVTSLVYGSSNWVAVGTNRIQYSPSGLSWSNVTSQFPPDVILNAVAYNSNQNRWVAGAVSTTADKSLWSSSNYLDWVPAQSGGFSTSILQSGVGYGIFTSSTYTYAAGKGSFTGVTETKQNILQVLGNGFGEYLTSNSLTLLNTTNVFDTQVRGIYGSAEETYRYVAVGDGETPQKTIGRSLTGGPNTWIPAVTGGFSTTGYGVTHYLDKWIAVGDAQSSSNTIQYSPDGANWFGTNTSGVMRLGGRGIGSGFGTLSNTLVALGKDTGRSTIVYSSDGTTWAPAIGSFYTIQGNAVAGGSNLSGPNFLAVGQDARGSRSTILQSLDGTAWSNVLSGGFTGGGFGIAYGLTNTYVAVGIDTNSNKTIQYSTDGGANFAQVNSGAFTKAGYGVSFNPSSNLYFAVGEDIAAAGKATIKYSSDGCNWTNVSTGSGFVSQTTLGAAYSVYTQQILNGQIAPYIEFSNFIIYEGGEPLIYPVPTLRVQSSFMVFNETLYTNLSSQFIINSNVPYSQSSVLTVYGNIYASSLLYTGSYVFNNTLIVSSLVVSTLSSVTSLNSIYLTTPSLAFNTVESKPNYISTYADSIFTYETNTNTVTNMVNINDALWVTANIPNKQTVGIATSTPFYALDVEGSLGTSSFSTSFVYAPGIVEAQRAIGASIRDPYFTLYSGQEQDIIAASNSINATPSSIILNSVLTVNLSSQSVGLYAPNPQFTLDVRRQSYLQTLSTPFVNTSLLFLTLQSA